MFILAFPERTSSDNHSSNNTNITLAGKVENWEHANLMSGLSKEKGGKPISECLSGRLHVSQTNNDDFQR